jgi:hypothetical protein
VCVCVCVVYPYVLLGGRSLARRSTQSRASPRARLLATCDMTRWSCPSCLRRSSHEAASGAAWCSLLAARWLFLSRLEIRVSIALNNRRSNENRRGGGSRASRCGLGIGVSAARALFRCLQQPWSMASAPAPAPRAGGPGPVESGVRAGYYEPPTSLRPGY